MTIVCVEAERNKVKIDIYYKVNGFYKTIEIKVYNYTNVFLEETGLLK